MGSGCPWGAAGGGTDVCVSLSNGTEPERAVLLKVLLTQRRALQSCTNVYTGEKRQEGLSGFPFMLFCTLLMLSLHLFGGNLTTQCCRPLGMGAMPSGQPCPHPASTPLHYRALLRDVTAAFWEHESIPLIGLVSTWPQWVLLVLWGSGASDQNPAHLRRGGGFETTTRRPKLCLGIFFWLKYEMMTFCRGLADLGQPCQC